MRPVVNLKTEEGVRKFEAIANEVADLVLEFGGALSGEHGDGLVRGPFRARCSARHSTRRSAPSSAHSIPRPLQPRKDRRHSAASPRNLRYGAGYQTRDPPHSSTIATTAAWPAPSKCAAASAPAARNSRARCARPTWRRATRRTRRAAAPTHCDWRWPASSANRLGDKGVHEVLDLCLECRACKSRVPRGRGRGPLQERIPRRLLGAARHAAARKTAFGQCAHGSPGGQPLAPLSNLMAGSAPVSAERALLRHRPPPKPPAWTRPTFHRRREEPTPRNPTSSSSTTPSPNYDNPEVGMAHWTSYEPPASASH